MKNNLKSNLALIIIGIITSFVLYFSLRDNFDDIVGYILNMNLFWFFVALFFMLLYLASQSYVTYELGRKIRNNFLFRDALKIELGTHFFNYITPFASGGQPYQIYGLKKTGFRLSEATTVSIQGFFTYQIALIFLGAIALIMDLHYQIFVGIGFVKNLFIIGFIINFLILFFLLLILVGKRFNSFIAINIINLLEKIKIIKNKEEYLVKWSGMSAKFHASAKDLLGNKYLFIKMIFMKFLALLIFYSIPVVILYSFSNYYDLNVFTSIIATTYVMFVASYVPTPGGSGGTDYFFIQFFGTFLSGGVLTSLMLMWRFVTYYLIIIIGIFSLNLRKRM